MSPFISVVNKENYDCRTFDTKAIEVRNQMNQQNKDTIVTTSSQILSDRTLNLKKEITNLDEEIMHL